MYLIQPTRHLSSFWQKKDYTHVHCLGFPAPGLRKLSWDTPEVLVHEETFEDKTGAMAMAILRGDDGMYHLKQTQDNMQYVRIGFFQVLGDRYPLQSKFALLCISYSRHDTFRLSGRGKMILTSIVLTNSRLPSPWVTKAVLRHPRGTSTRRNFWR